MKFGTRIRMVFGMRLEFGLGFGEVGIEIGM